MAKKSFFRPSTLPVFTLIAGGLGLVLRFIFLRTQVDNGGLLRSDSPLNAALYILSACTLAVIVACVLPLKAERRRSHRLFRRTVWPAFGCMFAGVGILLSALSQILRQQDPLTLITMVASFVAAACFALVGLARQKGSRPHYLAHAGIVVYLMLQLVCQYRVWSPEPQLTLYFFPLMALVFLMLTSYQALCLDIGKGQRWLYTLFNQSALFFCCISLLDSQRYFYLGMGIYCATNLCSMRRSHSRSRSHHESADDAAEPTEGSTEE